ncbi:AP-2 complex subunit sigma [Pestalotiopsis sp. IQ-011]
MTKHNNATKGLTLVHDFAEQVRGRVFLLTGPSQGGIGTNLQDHMKAYGPLEAALMDDGCWRVVGMSMASYRAQGAWKTLGQGCATTLRAALDPGLVEEEGVYLEDANITTDTRLVKEWATDAELAEKLWKLSEELVGQKFDV